MKKCKQKKILLELDVIRILLKECINTMLFTAKRFEVKGISCCQLRTVATLADEYLTNGTTNPSRLSVVVEK